MKTLILIMALFALAACNREGPAEKAGRSIDNAAKNVKEAVTPKK